MSFIQVTSAQDAYCRDESRMKGGAEKIAFPKTVFELAEAVKSAVQNQKKVTVQGARTGITGGAVPENSWIISTEKMNRITGIRKDEKGAYWLTVQAGVSLQQVQDFLKRPVAAEGWTDQMAEVCNHLKNGNLHEFAPNPTEGTASIGGLFACDGKGSNVLRYGGVADKIGGLSWVTAQGEAWEITRGEYIFTQSGCRLPNGEFLTCTGQKEAGGVKGLHPFEGQDLIDFLAGSEGRAGIAAQLELELSALPKTAWGVLYFFPKDASVLQFASGLYEKIGLKGTDTLISGVEYYDAGVLAMVKQNKGRVSALKGLNEFPQGAKAALFVVLEGEDEELLEHELGEQLELLEEAGGTDEDSWATMGRGEMEILYTLRHAVPELINTRVDEIRLTFPEFCKTASDCNPPSENFIECCQKYHNDIATNNLEGYVFGHILENRFHVNLLAKNQEELVVCHKLLENWMKDAVVKDGLLTGENGVGRLRRTAAEKILPIWRKEQLTKILQQLDFAKTLI